MAQLNADDNPLENKKVLQGQLKAAGHTASPRVLEFPDFEKFRNVDFDSKNQSMAERDAPGIEEEGTEASLLLE